jgi:hypothetical protein
MGSARCAGDTLFEIELQKLEQNRQRHSTRFLVWGDVKR